MVSSNLSFVEEPNIDLRHEKRIDNWNGWRRVIELRIALIGAIAALYFVLSIPQLFFIANPDQKIQVILLTYVPLMLLGIAYYVCRVRTKTIYDNPLKRIVGKPSFRDLNFFQFQCSAATQLGFQELGDFQQSGFQRTIFLHEIDRSIAVEIGVESGQVCFKIASATGDGRLLQTTTCGVEISENMVLQTVPPVSGVDGKPKWKTISEAIQKHTAWVREYLAENKQSELAILNEENLKLIMRHARSSDAA